MPETFYVKLISKKNGNLNLFESDASATPFAGSTGTAFLHSGKYVVTWDKENPVCRNVTGESIITTDMAEIITPTEFENYKLKAENRINAYFKNRYSIDLRNPHHVLNEELFRYHFSKTLPHRPTVFLGCIFQRPSFSTDDLKGIHFVNCAFIEPRTYHPALKINVPPDTVIDVTGINFNKIQEAM